MFRTVSVEKGPAETGDRCECQHSASLVAMDNVLQGSVIILLKSILISQNVGHLLKNLLTFLYSQEYTMFFYVVFTFILPCFYRLIYRPRFIVRDVLGGSSTDKSCYCARL